MNTELDPRTHEYSPEVIVLASPQLAAARALALLQDVVADGSGLVSFATGATFTELLRQWTPAMAAHYCAKGYGTHLDEYLGFGPERVGGMVHELMGYSAVLRALAVAGRFLPVPHAGDSASLARHEQRIADLGGVELQLLGIGRNGHLAFNEPGTPFELGFHRAALAETTRRDASQRFLPGEPPRHAITAGPKNILAARRLLLVATGANKAPAVAAMLRGPIGPACPASLVHLHPRVQVVLDTAAAG